MKLAEDGALVCCGWLCVVKGYVGSVRRSFRPGASGLGCGLRVHPCYCVVSFRSYASEIADCGSSLFLLFRETEYGRPEPEMKRTACRAVLVLLVHRCLRKVFSIHIEQQTIRAQPSHHTVHNTTNNKDYNRPKRKLLRKSVSSGCPVHATVTSLSLVTWIAGTVVPRRQLEMVHLCRAGFVVVSGSRGEE